MNKLLCLLVFITFTVNAIENSKFSLKRKIQGLLLSDEVLKELSDENSKVVIIDAVKQLFTLPRNFQVWQNATSPFNTPFFENLKEIIFQNMTWNYIRAFGLEDLKIRILEIELDAASIDPNILDALRHSYKTSFAEKMENLPDDEAEIIFCKAILETGMKVDELLQSITRTNC